jgi:SAM-dependent methyltransferase
VNWTDLSAAIVKDHLLARALAAGPLCDIGLELRLTQARRAILETPREEHAPLVTQLALQGHLNGYAWWREPGELEQAERLAADRGELGLLALASYRALSEADAPEAYSDALKGVLQRHVWNPARERQVAAAIATLTPIRGEVSCAVREQYEADPYPLWVEPEPVRRTGGEAWDILIAGCGTGRSAVAQAQRQPRSRILAVDLSRRSLAYGARVAADHGLRNLTFAQADILELPALGRRFHQIDASGVLHHLADPFDGARKLAGLLHPGGVMGLGLYSRKGRAFLQPAKQLATRFPPTPDGIRALRRAIVTAAKEDPIRGAAEVGDFFSASGCRDLLMHVQERELDLGDVRSMLEETRLTLLRFAIPPAALETYRARFPDDPSPRNLGHLAQFEDDRPDTFRGMYQFWAQAS